VVPAVVVAAAAAAAAAAASDALPSGTCYTSCAPLPAAAAVGHCPTPAQQPPLAV
jgi:hypothetical protein